MNTLTTLTAGDKIHWHGLPNIAEYVPFGQDSEEIMKSMEATEQITDEASRFLHFDEVWEAAATQIEARVAILSMSGMLAFAVSEHGGKYLDHRLWCS